MKLQEIIRNNYKFAGIAAASFLIDEGMKKLRAEEYDVLDTPKEILDGKAVLRRYHNKGAFFKFRENKTKAGDIAVRSSDGGSAGGVCADAWNAREKAFEGRVIAFTGRRFFYTYDRVMREYVVDYVSLKTGIAAIDRVVFNLADLCI